MTKIADADAIGVKGPYKGLGHYGERDALFFFAREHETSIVTANVVASRLTLVYGTSGVGKSSLLRAGVVHELRERAQENIRVSGTPGLVGVIFPADEEGDARRNSWRDDPIAELTAGISNTASELGLDVERPDPSLPFTDQLEAWTARLDSNVLLILDQFEEYFLYHAAERGPGTFFDELSRALTRPDLGVHVLISIREDAYSKLDEFKGRIPFLYDNYLRIDHLDREGGAVAIQGPLDRYNELVAAPGEEVSIEPELVNAILTDVQRGQLVLGNVGAGSVAAEKDADARIETPFLQLVLERLWAEEVEAGSRTLRLATLERLGGSERIVRTHLDAAMSTFSTKEKGLAARAFRQLVTPSGTKIAHLPSDLAALEGLRLDQLTPVLDKLAAARILRPIAPPPGRDEPRYEIFHDVLAVAILDWRARYLRERGGQRRRRRVKIAAGVVGAVVVAFLTWSLILALNLKDQKRDAQDRAFINEARAAEGFAGLFLARAPLVNAVFSPDAREVAAADESGAIQIWSTRDAAGTNGSHLIRVFRDRSLNHVRYDPTGAFVVAAGDHGVGVWSIRDGNRLTVTSRAAGDAAFNAEGNQIAIAGQDGVTTLVTWPGLRPLGRYLVPEQSAVRAVQFDADDRLLATANDDGTARVWNLATHRLYETFRASDDGSVYSVAFSRDGRLLVTGAQDGTVRVFDVAANRRLAVVHTGRQSIADASFSGDSRYIAAAVGVVGRVWTWPKLERALELQGHTDGVRSVEFNPTNSLVLTAGEDATARLWSVSLPDLIVALRRVEPAAPFRTSFEVTNIGGATSTATSVVLSGPALREIRVPVPPLRPGGVAPFNEDLSLPTSFAGSSLRVNATVNPHARAVEASYANNTASKTVPLDRPDLAVETLGVKQLGNSRFDVLVNVANLGRGRAGPTTVSSHPRGYVRSSTPVPALAPGAHARLHLILRAGAAAPAQQAEVTVDPDGAVPDENRQNNSDLTQPLPQVVG
ncbi:MAG TPA: CARDB domain-containing protein [Gaiellaceae bacterium]|nr:CARDB domain-containing protein [Gaiellaceae bacterium]